ncbi:MAG: sulfite exporter TauE/SafE family protein, partial [Candidatus Caenarcaniphilales bacterium]|nr:sulfite exporter TauE/SafE family protein [Candidatus Caenarcaniphilales bacterium]
MDFLSLNILVLIASVLGTVTGFGTSTIMLPVVMMFCPLSEALLFVTIIHWFNALARTLAFKSGFDKRLILYFGVSGILAAFFGAKTFSYLDKNILVLVIGSFLSAYSIFLWFSPDFKMRITKTNEIISGLVSGYIAGIFGMGGTIRAAFLSAFKLPKNIYLANSALILLLIDSTRLITYFSQGMQITDDLNLDIFGHKYIGLTICIFLSLVSVQIGKFLVGKIPE